MSPWSQAIRCRNGLPWVSYVFDLQQVGALLAEEHVDMDSLGIFDSDFVDHGLCGVLLGESLQ